MNDPSTKLGKRIAELHDELIRLSEADGVFVPFVIFAFEPDGVSYFTNSDGCGVLHAAEDASKTFADRIHTQNNEHTHNDEGNPNGHLH
jgi:hypothetical protein